VGSEDQFDPKKYSDDLHARIHRDIHERVAGRRADFRARPGGGLLPGVILIAIGAAILLDHLGVIPVDRIWRFWPLILIAVGAVRFVETTCNRMFSVVLMLIGTLFLLGNLGLLHLTWGELWPIILIAMGAMMIWGRVSMPRWQPNETGNPNRPGDPNRLTANTMFGGIERRITTSTFRGGNAQAIFGGIELDFRAADIDGEEALLYVEAVFGGIDIVVPERWMPIYEGQSMFGGYSDETRPPLPDVPGAPPRKRLILRGQAVFGGITVKN
jgi:predicted membrane protein